MDKTVFQETVQAPFRVGLSKCKGVYGTFLPLCFSNRAIGKTQIVDKTTPFRLIQSPQLCLLGARVTQLSQQPDSFYVNKQQCVKSTHRADCTAWLRLVTETVFLDKSHNENEATSWLVVFIPKPQKTHSYTYDF